MFLDYENRNTVVQNLLVTNNQIINSTQVGVWLLTALHNSPIGVTAVVDATFDNNIISNNWNAGISVGEFRLRIVDEDHRNEQLHRQ